MDRYQFEHFEVGAYQKAKDQFNCNGDSFFCLETPHYLICAVADGLGSGPKANEVSQLVITYIKRNHHKELSVLMEECNQLLRNKRGVVLSIIKIEHIIRRVTYSTVGNISCLFYAEKNLLLRVASKPGFLCGKRIQSRTQTFTYTRGLRFLLYTDGINLLSSSHLIISSLEQVDEVVDYIKHTANYNKDDVTFVVGGVRES
ncbi:MAG: SpoIIE family protein phosphatase [Bacillaceae bacterium]|nr:SpoIIE family protein phosphatase [Bacillaceae bacterium]